MASDLSLSSFFSRVSHSNYEWPTHGLGGSGSSYAGWMPQGGGMLFGPSADQSLLGLTGSSSGSRSILTGMGNFMPSSYYGNAARGPVDSVARFLDMPPLAPPVFGSAQPMATQAGSAPAAGAPAASPSSISANSGAEEADETETDAAEEAANSEAIKEARERYKTADHGYTEDEINAIMDEAEEASDNDPAKFNRIMRALPSKKFTEPTQNADGNPQGPSIDQQRQSWTRDFGRWHTEHIHGMQGPSVAQLPNDVASGGQVTYQLKISQANVNGYREYEVTEVSGPGSLSVGNKLYWKDNKWYRTSSGGEPIAETSTVPGQTTELTTGGTSDYIPLTPSGAYVHEYDDGGKAIWNQYALGVAQGPQSIEIAQAIPASSEGVPYIYSDVNGDMFFYLNEEGEVVEIKGEYIDGRLYLDTGGDSFDSTRPNNVITYMEDLNAAEDAYDARMTTLTEQTRLQNVERFELIKNAFENGMKEEGRGKLVYDYNAEQNVLNISCDSNHCDTVWNALGGESTEYDAGFEGMFGDLPKGITINLNGERVSTGSSRFGPLKAALHRDATKNIVITDSIDMSGMTGDNIEDAVFQRLNTEIAQRRQNTRNPRNVIFNGEIKLPTDKIDQQALDRIRAKLKEENNVSDVKFMNLSGIKNAPASEDADDADNPSPTPVQGADPLPSASPIGAEIRQQAFEEINNPDYTNNYETAFPTERILKAARNVKLAYGDDRWANESGAFYELHNRMLGEYSSAISRLESIKAQYGDDENGRLTADINRHKQRRDALTTLGQHPERSLSELGLDEASLAAEDAAFVEQYGPFPTASTRSNLAAPQAAGAGSTQTIDLDKPLRQNDDVMARWDDGNFYLARVVRVVNGKYLVRFYDDNSEKLVNPSNAIQAAPEEIIASVNARTTRMIQLARGYKQYMLDPTKTKQEKDSITASFDELTRSYRSELQRLKTAKSRLDDDDGILAQEIERHTNIWEGFKALRRDPVNTPLSAIGLEDDAPPVNFDELPAEDTPDMPARPTPAQVDAQEQAPVPAASADAPATLVAAHQARNSALSDLRMKQMAVEAAARALVTTGRGSTQETAAVQALRTALTEYRDATQALQPIARGYQGLNKGARVAELRRTISQHRRYRDKFHDLVAFPEQCTRDNVTQIQGTAPSIPEAIEIEEEDGGSQDVAAAKQQFTEDFPDSLIRSRAEAYKDIATHGGSPDDMGRETRRFSEFRRDYEQRITQLESVAGPDDPVVKRHKRILAELKKDPRSFNLSVIGNS